MENLFKKFMGGSIAFEASSDQVNFIYTLIRVPIYSSIFSSKRIDSILNELFLCINRTNGDINQLIADTILVFHNVPVKDVNLLRNVTKLIMDLGSLEFNITAIVGRDDGIYGAFGCQQRQVVTGFGPKLMKDFHRLNANLGDGIYVQRDLLDEIKQSYPEFSLSKVNIL